MTLNKQEFKILVMLYAANIDGNVQSEEVKVMLKKSGFDTVEKMEKLFAKMNDAEVLDCIRENKAQYAATETDRLDLIHDLCAIIEADEKISVMEEQMVRALKKILDESYSIMTLQQIETRCCTKSEELINKYFGNLVKEVSIEDSETIGDYNPDLPKQIEAEYYKYLKDLWAEIMLSDSSSFEEIIDKKHMSDRMTDDDFEMIKSAYNAVTRTFWERLTKTNYKDVVYYKGILKQYTEDLLLTLRCDFIENVRKLMDKSVMLNDIDPKTNPEAEKEMISNPSEEKKNLREKINYIQKRLIDFETRLNRFEQKKTNFDDLSNQIDKLKQEKNNKDEKRKRNRFIITYIMGCLLLAFFVICAGILLVSAIIICDSQKFFPLLIGGISVLLILAVLIIVFAYQTRASNTRKYDEL